MAQPVRPEDQEALLEEALLVADACRDDPCAFFEFALVEERTQSPIVVAPHQRVMVDFLLAHPRAVCMLPRGGAKTWSCSALLLWLLGRDPMMRGAVISATEGQAQKPLKMVRENIEDDINEEPRNPRVRWVFPNLIKSSKLQDAWTQTQLVIDRPHGIRDPSLRAVGYGGALPGARLNRAVIDDILDQENIATPEQRAKVYDWIVTTLLPTLDPPTKRNPDGGSCWVFNTAWHPDDSVHRLIFKDRWPALIMRIDGQIEIKNTDWDSPLIRPDIMNGRLQPHSSSRALVSVCRLVDHDPDPDNRIALWPEVFTPEWVEERRRESGNPQAFNRMYMNLCRDDSTSLCKQEFIEKCLEAARRYGVFELAEEYRGDVTAFTGVDLAFESGPGHDEVALFTFIPRSDGLNIILDIEIGQWDTVTVRNKCVDKARRFNSIVCVESNVGQKMMVDFVRENAKDVVIKPHHTGREKAHPEEGIPGIFLEMSEGMWAFPNGPRRGISNPVQRLIDACLYYAPSKHVDDVLMAMFLARSQARKWGMLGKRDPNPGGGNTSLGMQIMAR
jgi:hypothetical protein